MVKEAIDCEWKAMQGADRQIPPSLQAGTISKKIEYKSPDFKSYFVVCARIILPARSLYKTEYKDIKIGTWPCGNSSKKVYPPVQRKIPHVHMIGLSRSGKSVLLSHIAFEKYKRKEAVFVLDPHGDDEVVKINTQ